MKLYEIANEYEQIIKGAIDEETGEVDEAALRKLDEIQESAQEKGVAVASCIKNLMAEQEAVKAARVAMESREKRLEKEMERLKDYLKENMERCGIKEISCPYFVVKVKKNPASVDVKDESLLPEEYIKRKTVSAIDKIKIKEEIMLGVHVPGAELVQKTSVTIR